MRPFGVKPATMTPEEIVKAAKLRMAHDAPHLGAAIYAHTFIRDDRVKTMCVDEFGRVYYSGPFVEKQGVVKVARSIYHEVWHTLRNHKVRFENAVNAAVLAMLAGKKIGEKRVRYLWNLSDDAEINDPIAEQFGEKELPDGVYYRKTLEAEFGIEIEPDDVAEKILEKLLEKDEENGNDTSDNQSGGGQGEDGTGNEACDGGSGVDGKPRPWDAGRPPGKSGEKGDEEAKGPSSGTGDGDGADGSPGLDEIEKEVLARQTAEAIRQEAARGRGTIPAGLKRWADQKLAPPKVRWEDNLKSNVRRAVSYAQGYDDFTYSRPSTRRIPGIILPGMHAPDIEAVVVVDDSGSMGNGAGSYLWRAVAEVDGILRAVKARVTFIAVDSAVNANRKIGSAKQALELLTGGGGTDMRVGIEAAVKRRPKPNVVIVLTDGDTPWPTTQPAGVGVVVGLVGTSSYAKEHIPAWAKTVVIEDDAED